MKAIDIVEQSAKFFGRVLLAAIIAVMIGSAACVAGLMCRVAVIMWKIGYHLF